VKHELLYACPYCERVYKTRKEAESCPQPFSKFFKDGDIVRRQGRVWKMTYVPDGRDFGTIERVPDFLVAEGLNLRTHQAKSWYHGSQTFCRSEFTHVSKEEIAKLVLRRKKQLEAATRLLKYIESREEGNEDLRRPT